MMPDWTILDNCRHSRYATAMPWKRLIPLLPLLICDLSLPFYIYAAMAGITALAAFSLLRGEYEVTETNLRQYAVVIRNSRIQAALLGVMVLFLCVGVIEVMFPIYLSTQGYGKSDMGLLLLISAVGMLLTQP